jgi:hypothetical protein
MTRGDSVVAAVLAVFLFVHLAKEIDKTLPGAAPAGDPNGHSAPAGQAASKEGVAPAAQHWEGEA